jgi:glycosyltransferase involved in cell wall biosynthesis
MKICLFTPSFLPRIGGLETAVDHLAREFKAAGHEPVVLAKATREAVALPALPYPVEPYPRTRSQVWLLGSAIRALVNLHRRLQFDIINAFQIYPNGYLAAKARATLSIPVIATSQGGDLHPSGRYRNRWIPRRRMAWALRLVDAATSVNEENRQVIDDLAGGQARSFMIPNGADLTTAAAASADPPPALAHLAGEPFVLTLGRLHRYKGLDVLLAALGVLRSRGVALPRVVIAGDGTARAELEATVASLGLGDRVCFTGMVVGEPKAWLLANCLFLAQPSRNEGSPLTILEAMAAGKPILGSDIDGIRKLVTPGMHGLLAPPESAELLADALARMLSDGPALHAMAVAAKARATEQSWANIARQYIDLYQQAIARRAGGR